MRMLYYIDWHAHDEDTCVTAWMIYHADTFISYMSFLSCTLMLFQLPPGASRDSAMYTGVRDELHSRGFMA